MKCLILFLFFSFSGIAATYSQNTRLTLTLDDVSLTEVFAQIRKMTDYTFIYNADDVRDVRVNQLHVTDAPIEEVLDVCLQNTGFTYRIEDNVIVISLETRQQDDEEPLRISGRVTDVNKVPLPGVTVAVKGLTVGTATDNDGKYTLTLPTMENVTLIFSFIGMKTQEIPYTGQDTINVVLEEEVAEMDEVVVTGYQVIDRRRSTSAITSVKMEDLMIAGVSNVDQMLQGRIPDLVAMTASGEVGVVPKIRIRGTSTLIGNREPLWVVDGIVVQDPVKIAPEELNDPDYINRIGNAIAGLNPQDIERIDVLKDAAATALYGTKAANGVIVITTKRGYVGRPVVTYAMNVTMRQRPSYRDRKINVMNSRERVQFSRELTEEHYEFPSDMSMVGYEGLLSQLYAGEISEQDFETGVARLEQQNTDWFDLLTRNSWSHQHTLSVTGGSTEARYYASVGYNRDNDVIRGDYNERYSTAVSLDANLTPWLTASMKLNGNVSTRSYYRDEVAPVDYAYVTSRTIPAYEETGELYFYPRKYNSSTTHGFNILHELENSSREQEGSGLTLNLNLRFQFLDWLNANAIVSYSTSQTVEEKWWGEESYQAALWRGTEYGQELSGDKQETSTLPFGGELDYNESRNRSYTVRLQANANKDLGAREVHNIDASLGFEINSVRYKEHAYVTRGYYKDRGMAFVEGLELEDYPAYADWIANNMPELQDELTNTLSGYASLSYSYMDHFTINANARVDGSNGFGQQSNDKLLPIWSVSANWNVSELPGLQTRWIDMLRLKASFGYQGNMLDDQTPVLIIRKEPLHAYYNENLATIERYPNPELKWEKTASFNTGIEFSLFQNRLQFEGSYYWKRTEDAFMPKRITSVSGVLGNTYVVNGGTLRNSGYSVAVTATPLRGQDFRWTLSTSFSKVFNNLESNSRADEYTLEDFLNGTALVQDEAVGTFYSYRFLGLSPVDGGPLFDDGSDDKAALDGLNKYDTYTRVLRATGKREPTMSGSVNTSLRWRNWYLSGSFAYSLGNKIRLFAMYGANTDETMNTSQLRAENNASKDYLRRWRKPGDEQHTDIPAIISPSADTYDKYNTHWSPMDTPYKVQTIAYSAWQMYDYGDHRVVSGNYLKCSNLSLTYELDAEWLERFHLSRLALNFSGANLFTICSGKLKGQTPTQSGFATIQLSDRPQYSLGLTVSF